MENKKCIHMEICGIVQGVGMRHYVSNKAKSLGVTGYVKNLPNGRVECVAQGDEEQLQQLLELIKECPRGKVDEVYTAEMSAEEPFPDFTVRF